MFFNFVFFLYALFYFPYLIVSGRLYPGFGCRFGFLTADMKSRLGAKSIWIHAVSVGEVMAVSSLITELKVRYPQNPLVVTVTTKTGYELAKGKFSNQTMVIPSPLDFTWVVASFVKLINPKIYIVAETEIWPNLYDCLSKHQVPIALINGRISDTAYGRYQWIKSFLRGVLLKVSLFTMQSERDAKRIISLGAPQARVTAVGNIKFDDVAAVKTEKLNLTWPKDRLLWVAGSTHPGEEEIVLDILKRYQESCSLVIAPRHIERVDIITHLIESKGFKAVKFSQLPKTTLGKETVVVVDTIGHLRMLYSQASFVFVGKSLCVGGGHNIIEPAVYAKPILIGPRMENFRDIAALFKTQQALLQVNDAQELEKEVGRLIADETLRNQLGKKALAVVQANQGALARTLHFLKEWLDQ